MTGHRASPDLRHVIGETGDYSSVSFFHKVYWRLMEYQVNIEQKLEDDRLVLHSFPEFECPDTEHLNRRPV